MVGRAFAFTHSGFRRAGGHGFVGENADPELALALHIAREGYAGGFNLRIGNPGALERLERKGAEIDTDVAGRLSGAASSL
jgi:hypothetical protein